MQRLLGVILIVVVLYGVLLGINPNARSAYNQKDIAKQLGYYGITTIGVGVLIISGGIDLSIGSVVGLGAVTFALLLKKSVPPGQAALLVIAGGAMIGLFHGLLVTRLHLQPFLVTLCGLFIYRGLAWWAGGGTIGLNDAPPANYEAREEFGRLLYGDSTLGLPHPFLLLVFLSVLLTILLHATKYGRYLYAIGANEEAARYAGIATDRYKVLAYIICSALAGLASVLYLLENRSVTPTSGGSWLELYAITGAVLGGCSLRGGEGTIPGMFLGAAILPLLRKLCLAADVTNELEYAVIGSALLLGTIADEVLKRRAARREAVGRLPAPPKPAENVKDQHVKKAP